MASVWVWVWAWGADDIRAVTVAPAGLGKAWVVAMVVAVACRVWAVAVAVATVCRAWVVGWVVDDALAVALVEAEVVADKVWAEQGWI